MNAENKKQGHGKSEWQKKQDKIQSVIVNVTNNAFGFCN